MKKQLMKQVMNSIFEVMETMFYMVLEESPVPVAQALEGGRTRFKTAAVTFSGTSPGTIFISIPDSLLKTMTADFMGQDIDTLNAEHTDGTLKEALNMVAGSALTRVEDTAYMGLGIPQIVPFPDPAQVDETIILTTGDDILIGSVKIN